MTRYLVWDALNSSREFGKVFDVFSFEDAAVAFAEADVDGRTDGLYQDCAQPLMVDDIEFSERHSTLPMKIEVKIIEYRPVYSAIAVKEKK